MSVLAVATLGTRVFEAVVVSGGAHLTVDSRPFQLYGAVVAVLVAPATDNENTEAGRGGYHVTGSRSTTTNDTPTALYYPGFKVPSSTPCCLF